MLYLDPSPTPVQDRADFDLKLGLLKPCLLDVKNLQGWEIPQPGWAAWGRDLYVIQSKHLLKARLLPAINQVNHLLV